MRSYGNRAVFRLLRRAFWVATLLVGPGWTEEPLAFVVEVEGDAVIQRLEGEAEAAQLGLHLSAGDRVKVKEGHAILVYLSGRDVKIEPEVEHIVEEKGEESSNLVARLGSTLVEIVGPQSEEEMPAVHGMVRAMGLEGGLPANTRLSTTDFSFSWKGIEGVTEYAFTLNSDSGQVLYSTTVQGTDIAAAELGLQSGASYVWSVGAQAGFMALESGALTLHMASDTERAAIVAAVAQIEKKYTDAARHILQALAYYDGGFYYEASRVLLKWRAEKNAAHAAEKMLRAVYAKMGRLEHLPEPGEN